jgi:hypothetical protein
MTQFSPQVQGAYVAARLVAAGMNSPDDLVLTTEPCHCMTPTLLTALVAEKNDLCARDGCNNSTTTQGIPTLRLHRRGKICPIVHAIKVRYCSKQCATLDQRVAKERNPNMESVGFTESK